MNMKNFFFFLTVCGFFYNGIYAEIPPHDGRFARAEFVSSLIKPGDVGAEIGVAHGVFAYHVLLQSKPSKLYLIDPWQYGLQTDVELNPTPAKQKARDLVCEYVHKIFDSFPNVEIIRMKSEDAAILFDDEYFDYVYIDGEHSYEAVLRDLTNYFPKVKVGGYLIGDDYGWTGIKEAVQEFLDMNRGKLFWLDDPYSGRTGGQYAIRRLK